MKRSRTLLFRTLLLRTLLLRTLLLPLGCAHAAAVRSPPPVAVLPREATAADLAYAAATAELGQARIQGAGAAFKAFADAHPTDRRAASARLQEAFAALDALDQVRGLDEAQAILAQLPPGADTAALHELEALILARAQGLQAQAAVAELLNQCESQTDSHLDKERSQSRAQLARLQQELQRRERTLQEVKQRLIEIQQLAAEMLGAPLPPALPAAPAEAKGTGDNGQ